MFTEPSEMILLSFSMENLKLLPINKKILERAKYAFQMSLI
jgi:hypothetical protein